MLTAQMAFTWTTFLHARDVTTGLSSHASSPVLHLIAVLPLPTYRFAQTLDAVFIPGATPVLYAFGHRATLTAVTARGCRTARTRTAHLNIVFFTPGRCWFAVTCTLHDVDVLARLFRGRMMARQRRADLG